jgi:hypothetical protein
MHAAKLPATAFPSPREAAARGERWREPSLAWLNLPPTPTPTPSLPAASRGEGGADIAIDCGWVPA